MNKQICRFFIGLMACCWLTNTYANIENNADDFLDADQAFVVDVSAIQDSTLAVHFKIAPGYYLYKQRIHLQSDAKQVLEIQADFPEAQIKDDPNFGKMEIYHQALRIVYRLRLADDVSNNVPLTLTYQGCSEKGLCYPPVTKTLTPSVANGKATSARTDGNAAVQDAPTDEVSNLLHGGSFFLVIAGFFGFGLLLSLTPCVFPMIPILSSIIVGQGGQLSRMSSFNLSLAYTMGMALSYTIAGVVAGLTGNMISNALQTPAVIFSSAIVFLVLSLSMFGLYELKLPGFIESRVLNRTQQMQGGKWISVFVMGALSALVVSPCVAAPLAGALIYIGQTHDVVLGGVALFSLSLGMGMPLLVIGASAGALLPRAGVWMIVVRNFFGVLMIAMAIWLVSSQVAVSIQMLLWGVLLVVVAVYLGALDAVQERGSKWPIFWKGIGVSVLFMGFAMFIGALSGSESLLQPLSGLKSMHASNAESVQKEVAALPFKKVTSMDELNAAIQASAGRYVMLDFYADWCTACKEFEHMTFSQPDVKTRLQQLELIQVDVTQNTEQQLAMLKRFSFFGPPGIAFYDPEGHELAAHKIVGFMDADHFRLRLDQLLRH